MRRSRSGGEWVIASSPPCPRDHRNQLALAIGAFVVCFAVFGSVAAMMPALAQRLGLSEMQLGMALAAPVLLGSIGRIPVGVLADRFGGKIVYLIVMSIGVVPAVILPLVRLPHLLTGTFALSKTDAGFRAAGF